MTATAPVSAGVTAHLSEVDIKEIGRELDQLRDAVTASLGDGDARYIRRVIMVQRGLEVSGRTLLTASILPAEIAPKVRDLCQRYGLRYNTGSLIRQTANVWKNIFRLALPGPKPQPADTSPNSMPRSATA
ncbi:hypothetical protein ACFPIJ_52330 [Dactylosporangium cerinum]|uniref:Uncharacterized protein n=1 Tax=Dactylosporangium cerinum TaxID=1434730 RepID=A0ABV9WF63_9ACTN